MTRLDELLAEYPPRQRTELERELLAELDRRRAAALEEAALVCEQRALARNKQVAYLTDPGAKERAVWVRIKEGEALACAADIRKRKG